MGPTASTAYVKPEWRFRELLHSLGTANEICWLLFGKGYQPPPEDTVQGWRTRDSVPGCWVPVLLMIALEKGFIKSIADLKPIPVTKPRERKNEPRNDTGGRHPPAGR